MRKLIDNAIKFSPPKTAISLKLQKKENSVTIVVADQGIGIPLEIQDKLFNMPVETRRLGAPGEATLGLGLAIAPQIIEAQNGRIYLESTPGLCTTGDVELALN